MLYTQWQSPEISKIASRNNTLHRGMGANNLIPSDATSNNICRMHMVRSFDNGISCYVQRT